MDVMADTGCARSWRVLGEGSVRELPCGTPAATLSTQVTMAAGRVGAEIRPLDSRA